MTARIPPALSTSTALHVQLSQESLLPNVHTKLITSSGQSFQQKAENTIGLEKEK